MKNRIRIFVGHFGSGKSEVAINEAILASQDGTKATLADLDVVKPYFRCRLLKDTLKDKGIRLIAPEGDRFYADLPIILPEIKGAIQNPSEAVFLDAGGDDTGARIVGSFSQAISAGDFELLLVLNMNRPFTEDAAATHRMVEKIEIAAGLKLTGIISNTHLMDETTPRMVLDGYGEAKKLGDRLKLPVKFLVAERAIAGILENAALDCPVRAIERYILPPFAKTPPGRRPIRGVI